MQVVSACRASRADVSQAPELLVCGQLSMRGGCRGFYGECWTVFNALNELELKSLEEPRYLLSEFCEMKGSQIDRSSLPVDRGTHRRMHEGWRRVSEWTSDIKMKPFTGAAD